MNIAENCCDSWLCDQSWMKFPIGTELAAGPSPAGIVHTLTFATNIAILLGRLQLSWDETLGLVTIDPNGMQLSSWNFNRSNASIPADIFLPDSPGLVGANYLGVPLLPGQTFTIQMTSSAALSVSGLIMGRPLTTREAQEAGELRDVPGLTDLLYGLGGVAVGAGATATLTGTATRAVGEALGYLVCSQAVANAPGALRIREIRVSGQKIDSETVAADYNLHHRDHRNAGGRIVPIRSRLAVGTPVDIVFFNSTAGPLTANAGFIRAPSIKQADGSNAAQLRPSVPGFGPGTPYSSPDDDSVDGNGLLDETLSEYAVREFVAGRVKGPDAVRIKAVIAKVGDNPTEVRRQFGLLRKRGALSFLGGK